MSLIGRRDALLADRARDMAPSGELADLPLGSYADVRYSLASGQSEEVPIRLTNRPTYGLSQSLLGGGGPIPLRGIRGCPTGGPRNSRFPPDGGFRSAVGGVGFLHG